MSIKKKLYSRNFFIANLVILGIVIGFALAFVFARIHPRVLHRCPSYKQRHHP